MPESSRNYYLSSRFFQSIASDNDLNSAQKYLSELYGQRRNQDYHRNLSLRDRSVINKDIRWFSHFVPPPARVLECGAGTGTFAIALAEAGYEVTASDFYTPDDLEKLRRTHEKIPGLKFSTVDNLMEIYRREGPFDAVISIDVFEHILFPDQVLLEWKGFLKPMGTLSIICPNYSGTLSALRIALRILLGKSGWRYKNILTALGHAAENFLLDTRLIFSGDPAFVRVMPHVVNGRIEMTDSDMDTVHLPSSRGICNYLRKNGFVIQSWRKNFSGIINRTVQAVLPGHAPTVRIHARLRA